MRENHIIFRITRPLWLCGTLLAWIFLAHCTSTPPKGAGPLVQIEPNTATILPGTQISLKTAIPAQIFYTLDETKPSSTHGLHYTGPFALWASSTVRFVAIDEEGRVGPVGLARFATDTLLPRTYVFPPGGNYKGPLSISFETDPDASVLYSLDGRAPKLQAALRYTKPFSIMKDTVLSFFAVDRSGNKELLQRVTYNFPPILKSEPAGGLFRTAFVSVVLSANKPSSIDFRMLDGRPNAVFEPYKTPLRLSKDSRLVVFARDKKGASATSINDYAFIRAVASRETSYKKLEARASVSIDIEGFARPSWIIATPDRLVRLVPGKNRWKEPIKLTSLLFETAWMRSWDVNGDGLNDFLLGDTSGQIHLYRSLSAERVIEDRKLLAPWSPSSTHFVGVVPIDFDGDGQLDILLLDKRSKQSRLLHQTPTGYVLYPRSLDLIEGGVVAALAGDFDRDDKADLLILPGGTRFPYLLFGNAKGAFRRWSLETLLSTSHKEVEWLHAARTDFDNDGDLDLVLVGRGIVPKHNQQSGPKSGDIGTHIVLLRRIVGQEWKYGDALFLGASKPPVVDWRGVVLGDFDFDGFVDLFLSATNKRSSVWIKNMLGMRLFQAPRSSSGVRHDWSQTKAVGCADFFDDGRAGLALIRSDSQLLFLTSAFYNPIYVKPVLQGIRSNRNAIGTRIFWRTKDFRVRMREIGIRSTGPDQSALFFPIHFAGKEHVGQMTIYWSDGQVREIPTPQTNQALFVSPH